MTQNRTNQPKTKDRTGLGPVWVVGPGVRFGLVDQPTESGPVGQRLQTGLQVGLFGPVLFCLDSVRSGPVAIQVAGWRRRLYA